MSNWSASACTRTRYSGWRDSRCSTQPRARAVVSCPARMKVRMLEATSASDRPAPPFSSVASSRALSRSAGGASPAWMCARRASTSRVTRCSKNRAERKLATRPRRGAQSGAPSTSSGSMRAPLARNWFSARSNPRASPPSSSENMVADRMSKVRPDISLSISSTRPRADSDQAATRAWQTSAMRAFNVAIFAGVNRGARMRRARRHLSPSVNSKPSASIGPSTRFCSSPFS